MTYRELQGSKLDFGSAQLRPYKRCCVRAAQEAFHLVRCNGTLEPSAVAYLECLGVDRASDFDDNARLLAWLDGLPNPASAEVDCELAGAARSSPATPGGPEVEEQHGC